MERPRLRDNRKLASQELYPLGEIPSELIRSIGGGLVYLLAIGRKDIETGLTRFTWQPHGSQFTIHTHVPKNAIKFVVKAPPIISKSDVMNAIGFDESWINIL